MGVRPKDHLQTGITPLQGMNVGICFFQRCSPVYVEEDTLLSKESHSCISLQFSPNNCQGLLSFSLPFLPAAAEHKVALRPPSQHIAVGLSKDSKENGIAAQFLTQRRL